MALAGFLTQLFLHPGSLTLLILYLAAGIWRHLYLGYSFVGALQTSLLTIFFYILALGAIHILSGDHSGRFQARRLGLTATKVALILNMVIYGFLWLVLLDRQQRLGYLASPPLLNQLPGWDSYQAWTQGSLVQSLTAIPGWHSSLISSMFLLLPFFVLLPLVLLLVCGVRPGGFGFAGGDIKPALPFLGIFGAAFVLAGVSLPRLGLLLLTFLATGFQEGVFYRGVLQPLWVRISQSAAWGIAMAAILYGLAYLPHFLFRSQLAVPLAFAEAAGTMLFGAFLGYGVHRSGMLWPWILIHALNNLAAW